MPLSLISPQKNLINNLIFFERFWELFDCEVRFVQWNGSFLNDAILNFCFLRFSSLTMVCISDEKEQFICCSPPKDIMCFDFVFVEGLVVEFITSIMSVWRMPSHGTQLVILVINFKSLLAILKMGFV